MADGSITFSTALDNEQLEKDLKRAEREVEDLKRKIEAGKSEESFAKRQMEAAKEKTDEARRAVEKLREELGVADDGALASSLKDANREVAALEANMGKIDSSKSAIEEQMAQGEAAIRKTEQRLRDLMALLEELEGVAPEDEWEWHGAQQEIGGVRQAIEEANAALEKQIGGQDALNAKWQGLDEQVGEYAAKLEEASAKQSELAEKSSRLSEANAALKSQTQEQDRLTRKWRSTNEQTEKYTRQLERATQRQKELGEEYARTYSRAGAAMSAGMERARSGMDAFASRVNTMLKRVFVFGVILKGIRAIASALTDALQENQRFSASWENLRATVVGVANAIANLVEPAITGMVNAATAAIQTLAQTIDNIFGTNVIQAIQSARAAAEANWRQTDASKEAQKALDKQRKATKDLAKEQQKATKTLLAFDEINAMQAEHAEDAADALGDEAEELADPSTLMKPDWGAFDVGKIDATLAEIMLILGAALMAVGAILCFSGINIPLGITLMVIGALMIYTAYKEQWDKLPQEVRDAITGAIVVTGIVLVVLGAVLAFSGANIPLGIGMMVAGAMMLWTAVALNWGGMSEETRNVVTVLMTILSTALLVIGAILTFSGANVPLGIALMVAGAVSLAAVAAINWERMPEDVRNVVSVVMGVLGGALLVVGAILALTGVSLPLGIGLMAVGAVVLGADAALNWNTIQEHLDTVIPLIEAAVGVAFLAIGAILTFSGANVPLGIALLAVGALSLGKAIVENWDAMPREVRNTVAVIESIVAPALLVLGAALTFSGANVPLGVALLAGGALMLAHLATLNWNEMPEETRRFVSTMLGIVGAALVVLGIILCVTGVGIPIGIACIVAGAASLVAAAAINWDFLVDKVKEIWGKIVNFWNSSIAPIFTPGWWANLFGSIVNGLTGCISNGLNAFGGFIGGLANGITSILGTMQGAVGGAMDSVVGMFAGIGNSVVNGLRGVVNGFLSIVEGMLNGAISGVIGFANNIISGLSNIPGISIPSISFSGVSLPRLAQGAVIPPNREFMAVLGDQKSGTNIETPEALMRQVVRDEAGKLVADAILAIAQMGQQEGGGDVTLVLNVDAEELSRAVDRGNASRARRGDFGASMSFS